MTQIEYRDVTGVILHFSQEQLTELFAAMPPEQRRYARVLAETIRHPNEIWQSWLTDESSKGQWHQVRFYMQFLNLSQTDVGAPFGAAIVRFAYRAYWGLEAVGLVLGKQENVTTKIDKEVRQGSCEYSSYQH